MKLSSILASGLLVMCSTALAAGLPVGARAEVEALLDRLSSSGCQFNRNGSWYGATEASAHIRKKLDYLDGKGRLQSAEDFIRLAGTESSQSGKAYQVKCGSAPAQASAAWLQLRLLEIRQSAGNPTAVRSP